MEEWEYKLVYLVSIGGRDEQEERLSCLRSQGWELVDIYDSCSDNKRAYLRRGKQCKIGGGEIE